MREFLSDTMSLSRERMDKNNLSQKKLMSMVGQISLENFPSQRRI